MWEEMGQKTRFSSGPFDEWRNALLARIHA
jgi:hypothetical protein